MLESCPYITRCDAETRQLRGSAEHYCLGSKNWEFCPEFQSLSLGGVVFREYSRDTEITELVKTTILKDLKTEFQSQLLVAIISNQGEVLYRDRAWSETDLLVAQNLSRYKTDTINFGEHFKLQNKDFFLFVKIHELLMLVCNTKVNSDQLITIIKRYLSDYHVNFEEYLEKHPISFEKEPSATLEENIVISMFDELQKRLRATNPTIVIGDLNKIKEKIFELFSWNRIFYEVSVLIERLEGYPVQRELSKQERDEIVHKIMEWQENIRKVV